MKKLLKLFVRLAIIVLLVVSLLIILSLEKNPETCEQMSRGFARNYTMIMSKITSVVPFSLTELSFVILGISVILLLVFAIILLVKKKYIGSINRLIEISALILLSITTYHLSCEFAYHRESIPLPYYENKIEREEHVNIYNYFADDLNVCVESLEFETSGEAKTSLSFNEVVKEVKKAYQIINDNDYYSSHLGSVKKMVSSFLYREFQITGVTYSPLGEANINTLNTKIDLPFTIAHELAHTVGVMREDDANQLAFYVCLNSDHPYLRYSAYTRYFDQLEDIVTSYYLTDEERGNLHNQALPTLYKSIVYQNNYWLKHNLLKKVGDFFNDLYIKSSGISEGTGSYSGGSTSEHDPLTSELINPSLYLKLFFEKYYRLQSI